MTQSLKIFKILMKNNVDFEHIDLISVKPLDSNTILKSVKKLEDY